MIVNDIKNAAINFTGATVAIDDTKAVAAMKYAMTIIADKNGYDLEIPSAGYDGGKWNTDILPANNLGVTEVNIEDGKNTIYLSFRKRGRDIFFSDSNFYIIHYKALPTPPTVGSSTLEVHDIYFDALVDFMIGYARTSKWEGKDEPGANLIASFRLKVEEKYRIINKRTGPKQWGVMRHA